MTKKILVILTNESFLPLEGHGSRPYGEPRETKSISEYAPSSWQSPITSTHAPPSDKQTSDPAAFDAKHRPTGADILEIGHIWFKLAESEDWDLTFASPRGGAIAIDPLSIRELDKEACDRIWHNNELMTKLNHTYPLAWIKPSEYDAVIIPGAHAAMLDLPHCRVVSRTIAKVWEESGCVAAIGHGVAALLNVRCCCDGDDDHHDEDDSSSSDDEDGHDGNDGNDGDDGSGKKRYLLTGKRVACFTREEEEKSHLSKFLPYALDERVRRRGAKLAAAKPFQPHVVMDDSASGKVLLTAQSYPSVHQFIDKLVETLRRKPRR